MTIETRGHLLGCISALVAISLFYAVSIFARFATADGGQSTEVMAFEKEWSDGPEVVAAGARYYSQSCAECHADDASGDEGPDLRRFKKSDGRMAAMIRNGIHHEMPPFRKKYSDEQIHALITYLRSLP